MFATLDPTSRRLRFPKEREVVITDTVGFIRDLPPDLVAAFGATLEELNDANLLLHVIDASSEDFERRIEAVRDVLRPSIKAIVVDSQSAYDRVTGFLGVIAPRSAPRVVNYRRTTPLFHACDVERQIEMIHAREVPLPSGGAIVIDQTE